MMNKLRLEDVGWQAFVIGELFNVDKGVYLHKDIVTWQYSLYNGQLF